MLARTNRNFSNDLPFPDLNISNCCCFSGLESGKGQAVLYVFLVINKIYAPFSFILKIAVRHCWWYCCNLSGGVALIVRFTRNGMCAKNNTIIYVRRASNSERDCEHDLYCCLLLRCEALRICRSGFPIATILSFGLLPYIFFTMMTLFC